MNILGTTVEDINRAEDRDLFNQVIQNARLAQPKGDTATTVEEAVTIANTIGYPVLVRPSYVLGGRGMAVVQSDKELINYMTRAVAVSHDHPVLIDDYLEGFEAEVDVLSDGKTAVIPGIMEHIEKAGVHSGDSMVVYPTQRLSQSVKDQMTTAAIKLAKELQIIGMMNIQFVIKDDIAYVIEVNPRASRTVPFISKITNTPLAQLATQVMLGQKLSELGFKDGVLPETELIHVKAPVFSFNKIHNINTLLGPEMKSTGEVMGTGRTYQEALYKAFVGAGIKVINNGTVLLAMDPQNPNALTKVAQELIEKGFKLLAINSNYTILKEAGIESELASESELATDALAYLRQKEVEIVINTCDNVDLDSAQNHLIRSAAIEDNLSLFTALDTINVYLSILKTTVDQLEVTEVY